MRRFASFWVYPPAAIALLAWSLSNEPSRGAGELLASFALGLLAWTLLEYVMHRWLFHYRFRIRGLEEFRQQAHISHHKEPRNLDHLLVKLRFSLPVSTLFGTVLYFASGSPAIATAILCGLWCGFLYYEAVHYRMHFSTSQGRLLAWQRKQHFHHHFVEPDECFGVTTPLWDILLGTYKKSEKRRPSSVQPRG